MHVVATRVTAVVGDVQSADRGHRWSPGPGGVVGDRGAEDRAAEVVIMDKAIRRVMMHRADRHVMQPAERRMMHGAGRLSVVRFGSGCQ